jgi:hypothetical protein
MIRETIERIQTMEQSFDMLQKAEGENPDTLRKNAELREMLRLLRRYYEDGQWLRDYELDEQGLLPQDLKRGVLSQDGVYDFLERMEKIVPKEDV